ncbi:MAG: hypothetical protein ACOCRK_06970, partial [bacterium]
SNLMVRREAFLEIGGFDETFQRNQDIEFSVRLLKKYKIAFVDQMGLIYHKHLSSENRSFDMDKITAHYIRSFESDIKELSEEKKNKFYRIINLQLFRYRVLSKKSMIEGIRMIQNKEVTILDVVRYFLHLSYRRISKKSYGFKI